MPRSSWDDDDDSLEGDFDDSSESTYPCPGCGRQIYEEADACPYCGEYVADDDVYRSQPQPWWIKLVVWLLIFSLLAGVLLAGILGWLEMG